MARDTGEETSPRAVAGHNSLPAGSLYLNLVVFWPNLSSPNDDDYDDDYEDDDDDDAV